MKARTIQLIFLCSFLSVCPPTVAAATDPGPRPAGGLAWDGCHKAHQAKPGDVTAHFTFLVTNRSTVDIMIHSARSSCGCTVARLPAQPWCLVAGSSGAIDVTVDLRRKRGQVTKTVTVETSAGPAILEVRIMVPGGPTSTTAEQRLGNLRTAFEDRQAVFRGDCASCHATPARGKMGRELYQAACAICHESPHRASIVPDLKVARRTGDAASWKTWIGFGREKSLMPAFAAEHGGPLTDAQIQSLVDLLFVEKPSSHSL